jgi:hypothetical protein
MSIQRGGAENIEATRSSNGVQELTYSQRLLRGLRASASKNVEESAYERIGLVNAMMRK